MGWAFLGLKLVPLIIQAVTSTERRSVTKGQKKQDEAMQLLTQLLTISQGSTATPLETDLIREAEPETRALIDALIAFQNRTTAAADAPPARR